MKVSQRISRRERRAIKKLGHTQRYKKIVGYCKLIFSPIKYFVYLPFASAKKAFGIISFSVYRFFGFKVAYVDDFIIHKKLRGQGHAKKIFETAEQEIREKKCDYLLLFSDNKRKASHKFYKKMGLTIIGLGVGIIAFKKINNQK